MAKRSLLLVDGDAKSLRVLEVSLKKAGFNVTTAMSGREALEKAKNSQPDLVISDTDLITSDSDPDELDGYGFCREFKENPEWTAIPFVFLTGQTAIEHKIRGLELGVDDYLTKPIYIKEILTRARILLQKRDRANFEQKKDNNTRFAGRLNDMGVVDLIQTIEVSRKTGVIHFRADEKRQATLFFKEGKVIDAEAGHLQGEDAVYRLLTWSDGEFEALFRPVRRKPVIEMSAQALLMEGMRRLDEWGRLQEQLPPLTQKFEVVYDELWDRLGDLPDDLNQILRLFDSRRTLAEVIDGANTGDLEAVEIISKLYFEGIIVEVGGGQGTPSGTFPVDALLKQRNRVTVPPDIEDTVPDQPRVYDASDAGWTTSDPLNLDYAASRAIAASELAAAEERGLLGSDQVPTPVPDPAHLANLLDQAITEAKPLASTDRSDAVQQDSTAGFAVAQLKVAKLETTREELLAANLRKHGSDAKKSIEAPVSTPTPVPGALGVAVKGNSEVSELEEDVEAAACEAVEAEEATDVDLPTAEYEMEAEYADDEDQAPARPYIEEVQVAGVISSAGAVNAAVSGSLAITTLPTPSKMPKPGFEDEPEPGEEKREPASGTTKKKAKFGTRSAAISSYDNLDDESEPSNGFPTWLGVAAVAAAVLAVVLITGRDARNSAQASSSDAGLRMAQPSIGTPLLPIAEDAATVSPPKTVAVAVATPDPIATPDPATDSVATPDPIATPDPVKAPAQDSAEEQFQQLLIAARRAERDQDRLEALVLLDEALELRQSSTALSLKAQLLVSLGDSASALKVARELTRVAPRRAEGWRIRGLAEYEQKVYKDARSSFTRYLELAPSAQYAADVRALLDSM